jgi:hypothetical protein
MAKSSKSASAHNRVVPVEDYEHSVARRTNNPPAGLAHLDRDETPTKTLSYDPHLGPAARLGREVRARHSRGACAFYPRPRGALRSKDSASTRPLERQEWTASHHTSSDTQRRASP